MKNNETSGEPSLPPEQTKFTTFLKTYIKRTAPAIVDEIVAAFIVTLIAVMVGIGSEQFSSRGLPTISPSLLNIVGAVISIAVTLFAVVLISLGVYRRQANRRDLALKRLIQKDGQFFDMIQRDVSRLLKSEVE